MAEGIDNLLEQLNSLVSQNNAVTGTIENLTKLRDLVNQISAQGTAGLSSAQQSKLRTAQAIIKQTSDATRDASRSAQTAADSTNNMTAALTKMAGGAAIGALAIGAYKASSAADKAIFKATQMDKVFPALGFGAANSVTDAVRAMYDQGIIPVLQETETAFGSLFGEVQNASAEGVKGLGADLSKAAFDTAALSDKLGKSLGNTTNSLRFFRSGVEGQKEVVKDFGESLKDLLPVLPILGKSAVEVSLSFISRFKNALNLSGETLQALGRRAAGFGTDVSDELMEVERTAFALSKRTSLDRKVIGTNLATLRGDFMTFGNVSTAELGKVTAKAMAMGIEVSKLKGIADTFDDFDKSAESVAVLSQALGVNIDAFKLFDTESPLERLNMIREGFLEAGQDITQMNRRQKKLIANLGIDPEALLPALGKGAGRETATKDRAAIEGLDVRAIESTFVKLSEATAAQAEKYFEGVAVLTTRNLETITQQFQGAAQNFALGGGNREALMKSAAALQKIPDIFNDAISGIPLQTGAVSKEAIEAIKSSQNKFSVMLAGFGTSVAEGVISKVSQGINMAVGKKVINPENITAKAPTPATTVSPATQQTRTVEAPQQTQATQRDINFTLPVTLQMNEIELGSGIAHAKLPSGVPLGQLVDNMQLQLDPPAGFTPNFP